MNATDWTTTELGILIAVALLLVAGLATLLALRSRRTKRLRGKFGGTEYALAMDQGGTRRRGEAGLEQRTERVGRLDVRPLTPADRARYAASWQSIQARFVNSPAGAVTEADQLLGDVMATRGYPVGDFEQRAADISVDHPQVLASYRTAHEVALRQAEGQAGTEDLRQAMIHFRSLFDELMGAPESDELAAAS